MGSKPQIDPLEQQPRICVALQMVDLRPHAQPEEVEEESIRFINPLHIMLPGCHADTQAAFECYTRHFDLPMPVLSSEVRLQVKESVYAHSL